MHTTRTVHPSVTAAIAWAAEEFFPTSDEAHVDVLARHTPARFVGEFRVTRDRRAEAVVTLPDAVRPRVAVE